MKLTSIAEFLTYATLARGMDLIKLQNEVLYNQREEDEH